MSGGLNINGMSVHPICAVISVFSVKWQFSQFRASLRCSPNARLQRAKLEHVDQISPLWT